jgi:hypothetical protein
MHAQSRSLDLECVTAVSLTCSHFRQQDPGTRDPVPCQRYALLKQCSETASRPGWNLPNAQSLAYQLILCNTECFTCLSLGVQALCPELHAIPANKQVRVLNGMHASSMQASSVLHRLHLSLTSLQVTSSSSRYVTPVGCQLLT